ncbi:MAG TPA: SagB/ThcOx family dehydrogenase [Candidatus Ozemobacteraceae bacterium]|nr:SagB/ThcOx family dehydrogenase [Candidatus Ozemobacteraceae bacterium]
MDEKIRVGREFLKDAIRLLTDFAATDQSKGVQPPPFEKPVSDGTKRVMLPQPAGLGERFSIDLARAVTNRRSRRAYLPDPLSLEELSWLLWATQGVQKVFGDRSTFRTVPSAGARHALETYLAVSRVTGLEPGLYRFLPIEHELICEYQDKDIGIKLTEGVLGQSFALKAAVSFIWTTIPYRMEWRYGAASHKVIALDAGHVCQNLYLACEAIHCGTCAIAAYHQEKMDALLRVDGTDEFTIYVSPVGRIDGED